MNEKALNYLGLMRKAGMLELGETGAGAAVKSGKAELLLITPDAGENARHRAESFVNGRRTTLVELPFPREEFSRHIGKSNTVMAAVTDAGFAAAFMKSLAEEDTKYAAGAQAAEARLARLRTGKSGTRRNNA
jgi:ribosomal protein L7Ae-like RNA K-turn-binding protein